MGSCCNEPDLISGLRELWARHPGESAYAQHPTAMNETSNPNTQIRNIQGWSKTLSTTFINRYVFPDGELDCVSNIQLGMERCGFEIHDVEGLRPHYALTLRHWVQRLEARREEALREVDEPTYRVWRLYMAACALEFEAGGTGVYQILASKRNRGVWSVPMTRHDLYVGQGHQPRGVN